MDFLEMQRQLEEVISKYDDVIGNEAKSLALDLGIQPTEKYMATLKKIEDENRLLQIGIVGRVKAGKSSLLNALLFDGKSVLPKAATPMTAALTIISYGEKLSAEVDFYSEDDISNIRSEHQRYLNEKQRITEGKYEQLKKKRLSKKTSESKARQVVNQLGNALGIKKLSPEEDQEIKGKAEKAAKRELKNKVSLTASYDLYEKIKKSGITNVTDLIRNHSQIDASDYSDLSNKLLDYVAADGKYMPFTKSVHVRIPDENIKNIQIVDTPGINDPVLSREARTRELLKLCDVVLIVSPSGQFLSSEDTELMDRITSKEGVRELFVVASQVDNQLFGSIKTDSSGDLHKAIDLIVSNLSEHMYDTLLALKRSSPEIGDVYDQLIEQSSNKIIHSSGICQTMISFWDQRNDWDSATQTAWENLKNHYPDYFSDNNKDLSVSNLQLLANTGKVNDIIQDVRVKKDSIMAGKTEEFLKGRLNAFMEYSNGLLKFIENRTQEINDTDIDELREQRHAVARIRQDASVWLDETYDQLISELELSLENTLFDELDHHFHSARKSIDEATGTKTETWTVKDSRWWNPFSWGKSHTESRTYATIRTGAARVSIEDFTTNIERTISNRAKEIILD